MPPKSALEQDPKKIKKLPLVPRKKGWPIIGNVEFLGDKGKFCDSCDGLTRLKFLHQEVVLVPEQEQVEKLYKLEGTHIRGGASVATMVPLLGINSLVAIHGPQHKALRSVLLPCFRPSDLLKTAPQIQAIAGRRFKAFKEKGTFNATDEIQEFAFELAMSFIGVDFESVADRVQDFMGCARDLLTGTLSVKINLGKHSKFGRGMKARKTLLGVARDAIRARKKQNEEGKKGNGFMENDMLQRMIDARDDNGNPLPEEVLLDNMLLFIMASLDTTYSSMIALILNMCRFQDVQDKVHKFIRDVLGPESEEYQGGVIPDERWHDLEYMDQLIYETQRYDPPLANSSTRITTKDFELDGYRITKGTIVLVDIKSRSRSSKYWDNPEEFNPDRFDPCREGYKHKVAALNSFGGGTKKCIGYGFAKLELKVYATLMLRDYKVEFANPDAVPNVAYPLGLILDGPLDVKITPREKSSE